MDNPLKIHTISNNDPYIPLHHPKVLDRLYTRPGVHFTLDNHKATLMQLRKAGYLNEGRGLDNMMVERKTITLNARGRAYARAYPSEAIVRYHYPDLRVIETQATVTPTMRKMVAEWAMYELDPSLPKPDNNRGLVYMKTRGLDVRRNPHLFAGCSPELDAELGLETMYQIGEKTYFSLRDIPLPEEDEVAVAPHRQAIHSQLRVLAEVEGHVGELARLVLRLEEMV